MNRKVGSSRVKQYKSGVFKAFSDLVIAYIPEDSFKLPSILARKAVKNAAKIETDLTDKNIQTIIKLVNELAQSNTLNKVIGNMVLFTRRGTGYCPISKCEHVNDNTHFVIIHDKILCLHCRHSEMHCGKKTTLVLGYLDSSKAEGLRRALLIVTDKIPDVFEQQNIHNESVTTLNLDKAKDTTMAPDSLLVKSPMGTRKTKALAKYLNSDQVPEDARVIIISFCKSFTSKLHKNIGPDFFDYRQLMASFLMTTRS